MNISDETLPETVPDSVMLDIVDEGEVGGDRKRVPKKGRNHADTRTENPDDQQMEQVRPLTIEECTNKVIREPEAAKARIFLQQGKITSSTYDGRDVTAQIDDDYLVIGGNIDEITQTKIVRGDYVDFNKLIPRDKFMNDGDMKLELVVRNGKTFWAPVTEIVSINSFAKWEQAFRIFSNIYT